MFEDPVFTRPDRISTLTTSADIWLGVQLVDVTATILPALRAIIDRLPQSYANSPAGAVEETAKPNAALPPRVPVMVVLMVTVIMLQTRSSRLTALLSRLVP